MSDRKHIQVDADPDFPCTIIKCTCGFETGWMAASTQHRFDKMCAKVNKEHVCMPDCEMSMAVRNRGGFVAMSEPSRAKAHH